ncbi:hypothetical protein TrCOL_g8413 [Triparma columacea]|uniref:Uncharacterized protein n=1 Tax=Triparma columacea TaxID=722753 RepID=A0A9W7LDE7_9STRA|nr:hypothetical protein TrCOL_g8413 [Triparma columacea]
MSGTSRRSKRLKAQPAVVAYLKSVTGYYLALEETLAAVNSALSPPRVLTPSTFAEVKGLVESLGRLYEGHPGFRAGVDLGYRSRVFGGSTLFMIAAARCPPEGRGNQIDVWFKIFKYLTTPSSGLKCTSSSSSSPLPWVSLTDSGGFTVWHHVACKGRGDVMLALLKVWEEGGGSIEEARDGFLKRGVIDVKKGRGGGVVRYRKVLEGGGTVKEWAEHYKEMGRRRGVGGEDGEGDGRKGIPRRFQAWCEAMEGNFRNVERIAEHVEGGKWGCEEVKE